MLNKKDAPTASMRSNDDHHFCKMTLNSDSTSSAMKPSTGNFEPHVRRGCRSSSSSFSSIWNQVSQGCCCCGHRLGAIASFIVLGFSGKVDHTC